MTISRRTVLLGGSAGLVLQACAQAKNSTLSPPYSDNISGLPTPTKAQLTWQQAELGAVFHYDLHVFDGKRYKQKENHRTPIDDIDMFSPDQYDIDQWFEAVKGMGAKYALITATHETGFALWPSKANPWNISKLKWRDGKANIVKDFVDACRRHDILPGIYLGVRWNSHLNVHSFRVTKDSPVTQDEYNRMVEGMVLEVCRDFGPLVKLWFDGGILSPDDGGPDVLPIVKKYQPDTVFYRSSQRTDARWAGNEDGVTTDPCWHTIDLKRLKSFHGGASVQWRHTGLADGPDWCPAMADAPLRGANGRHEWFWEPGDEENLHSADTLVKMYEQSVGRGGTLVIGLTPDPHGLVPDGDVSRCIEWGNGVQALFAEPLGATSGKGDQTELEITNNNAVKRIVVQEDITKGQRIRAWYIDVLDDTGNWLPIAEGTAIGHKRIVTLGKSVSAKKIRLHVTKSVAKPIISTFAAYGDTKT